MPNGISNRQKRAEQLHKKRARAALAAPLGGKKPVVAVPIASAAKRAPPRQSVAPDGRRQKLGMADRIFLKLNDRLALGADDLQWILYKSSRNKKSGALNWTPISYVSSTSTKDILLRCVRESGLGDSTAASALESVPSTFDAWKAAVEPPDAAATALEREPA
jgi:hypothetical protein